MKTVTIEVDPESAREFLASIEGKIAEKRRAREELDGSIAKLEESAKRMREQLHGVNGQGGRLPRGENRRRLMEYLQRVPGGATLTTIAKSTGVGISSTSYTLKNNRDFAYDSANNLWKLK